MPIRLTIMPPPDFVEFRNESIFQGIHERFEEQRRLYPANLALKSHNTAFTYAEANGFANSMATEILSRSGMGMAQAAILLPNSPQIILAILATLKAHKTYVPLDPNFPKDRLCIMLQDAEPVVLITDDQHMAFAEELAGRRARIINTSEIKLDVGAPNPHVPCDPVDRAYILFTSGSTGRPKGIAFLHRNLLHTTMCLTNKLFFAPSDKVTWLHSACFSASVVDIYCCLMNGGTLYPWDVRTQGFIGMADWLAKEKVTTLQWIPSAFRQFLRIVPNDFMFQDIRLVVMASESLTLREVELFRRHFRIGSCLVNQVGTSESYNYCLFAVDHHIPIENTHVPGGYAVSNDRQVVILDNERRELPLGCVGEIGVKSDFMSAGYWRDETLTQTKFILIGDDKVPVFLTGDFGKLEPDGCLIHFGRKDTQVKIRGYRVELTEIDNVLITAPGVVDSAVIVIKNRFDEDQLVGYVVVNEPGNFQQHEIEKYLESRLPDYMVPRRYVIVDSLPTLPTGKINRKGLPNPPSRIRSEHKKKHTDAVSLEDEILALFKDLLKSEDIGGHSNFLEAGGDSLLTAVLMLRIYQRFGIEIGSYAFSESPTPANLASLIKLTLRTSSGNPSLTNLTSVPGENACPGGTPPAGVLSGRSKSLSSQKQVVTLAAVPIAQTFSRKQNLIIINAGKLGRETYTWASQAIAAGAPWQIKGFLDNRSNALAEFDYDTPILGDVQNYQIQDDDVFIGAVGNPKDKVKYYSPIIEHGGRFINLIHPLANIGKNVILGTGITMAPFSSITCDVKIGNHVSIGALSNVGHDTAIADWCQISSHVGINGNSTIGKGVFLGSHVCIIPGRKVGDWSFAGAGSVVVQDIKAGVRVFGNPAVPIGVCDVGRMGSDI